MATIGLIEPINFFEPYLFQSILIAHEISAVTRSR